MIDKFHSICQSMDPEDVEKLMSHKKHKARKNIIKNFLIKSYFSNFKNIEKKYEYALVINTYNFLKISCSISLLFSLIIYKYAFSGVYEFRNLYVNASSTPLLVKLVISGTAGYWLARAGWLNYCYNGDIYELAVRDLLTKSDNNIKN